MAAQRQAARLIRLLELLNDRSGPVPVGELVALAEREFGVSEVTLRADLTTLCAWRPVRKMGRGAFGCAEGGAGGDADPSSLFATRRRSRAEAKAAIAAAVVQDLRADTGLRVLLLDAGTTAFFVADQLCEVTGLDLIVWTPSLPAATRLATAAGISVRLLGGEVHASFAAVAGDETVRSLVALAGCSPEADIAALPIFPGAHCILDVNAVGPEGALYTDESTERVQKRLMAHLADTVTVIADASKLFQPRFGLLAHEVCSLAELAGRDRIRLVTDSSASEVDQGRCTRMFRMSFPGHEVMVREEGGAVVLEARRR
ncbi:MAG: DeoR/GlpR transcriptional regulator [Armatimonadetes bacterium]|nr:DeoR/GlpR transcriptional regulator [Armatimonadota bacterium]